MNSEVWNPQTKLATIRGNMTLSTINCYAVVQTEIHWRPSSNKFLSGTLADRNKAFNQDISHLKCDYQKCKVVLSGHKLLFLLLENAVFVQLLPALNSITAALTPGLHLHSWNIAPRTNLCTGRMFNVSQTPITAVFRCNTNTCNCFLTTSSHF